MGKTPREKAFRVGVMLDLSWNLKRHNDVFAGVARYAKAHDWQCVVDDFAVDTLHRAKRRQRPFDGIIARVTPELAKLCRRRKLPLINVWYNSPVTDVPSAFVDVSRVGELVGEHLLASGIRHVLCVIRRADKAEKATAERIDELFKQHGGRCDIARIPLHFADSPSHWKKTRLAIDQWLRNAPVPAGIFIAQDIMARHLVQICDELGLRVPQDMAVVGGYNEPTICLYPEPTLSSIEYGLDHVGFEAARMMNRLLKGESLPQRVVTVPPREFIARNSSDYIYVDEEIVSAAMQYIAQHARWPIDVDEVAIAAGASRRTLEMRFKKHLGRTVAAEIRRVRLEQAKRLLASSDESIGEIARATGIGTPQQFARVFRREVGIAPRDYRAQLVDNE